MRRRRRRAPRWPASHQAFLLIADLMHAAPAQSPTRTIFRPPAACRHRRSVRLPSRARRVRAGIRRRRRPRRPPRPNRPPQRQRVGSNVAGPSKRCATQLSAASECSPRNTTRMRWSHASRSRQNRAPWAVSPAIAAGPFLPPMVEIVVPKARHVAGHCVDDEAASGGATRERDAGGEPRVVKNLVERHRCRGRVSGERGPRCHGERRSRQADLQELSATRHHRPDRVAHRLRIIRCAVARNRPPKRAWHGTRGCYTGRA